MIVAFIKTYNSERFGLVKCLDSIQDMVDRIIIGDGRFPSSTWGGNLEYWEKRYPPGNMSTDGTYGICKRYRNMEWIPAPETPYPSETDKMNTMLKHVPDDSWVLMIDPDERMMGDIRPLVRTANGTPGPADIVPMIVRNEGGDLYYHRLFRKKPGVTFSTHHSLLYPMGGIVELYLGGQSSKHYIYHDRVD